MTADVRAHLDAAVAGAGSPLAAADRLCEACVDLLEVDGASISLVDGGSTRGTFGSSGTLSRTLDELQFTFGEGPCLDAVAQRRPVLVPDLDHADERRWPALTEAMLEHGIRSVFALPVAVSTAWVGALDLYRRDRGALSEQALTGGLWAARLAAVPLLDLMTADVDWATAADGGAGWEHLASLERVEVYQATGVIMAAAGLSSAEALVRLRGHAIARSLTASQVAWAIIEKRLVPGPGGWTTAPDHQPDEGAR